MYPFRKYREKAGLSQKEAAITLKVKPPSMVEWEKGKSNPTIENLINMARLYHVSVDTLLGMNECAERPAEEQTTNRKESKLVEASRRLNDKGIAELIRYAGVLSGNLLYTEENPSRSAV